MPLIDFPLPQLLEYQGRSPCPADFDQYWSEALGELDRQDLAPRLAPSSVVPTHNAECFDLWFTGVGGSRVHAKYLRPVRAAKPSPALLIFHGYSGNSGDWLRYLAYVSEGYCVASLDCRGQAGSSEDTYPVLGNTLHGHIIRGLADPDPKALLFRRIFLDTAALARIVMAFPEVDAGRVGALGESQGGALTLVCASLEPRVRAAVSVYPFLCDYRRVWEMDLARDAYLELRNFFRSFDPLHAREAEIFARLGYIDVQYLVPRIKAEVLLAVGLMDTVCPPSSQFAAYNKITAPKELAIYPDFAHESLPGITDRAFAFLAAKLAG